MELPIEPTTPSSEVPGPRAELGAAQGGAAGELLPGLTATVELLVTDADTAQAVGSGDVPVLGTPRVLALAEAATVAATTRHLPSGATTVGLRVELSHLAPTPVGRTVTARARLTRVEGRRLHFEIAVCDGTTTVAEGRVERVLVDRHRFVSRAVDTA
jgi:fluoroacetyl-CoA thioesterase